MRRAVIHKPQGPKLKVSKIPPNPYTGYVTTNDIHVPLYYSWCCDNSYATYATAKKGALIQRTTYVALNRQFSTGTSPPSLGYVCEMEKRIWYDFPEINVLSARLILLSMRRRHYSLDNIWTKTACAQLKGGRSRSIREEISNIFGATSQTDGRTVSNTHLQSILFPADLFQMWLSKSSLIPGIWRC